VVWVYCNNNGGFYKGPTTCSTWDPSTYTRYPRYIYKLTYTKYTSLLLVYLH